MYLTKVSLIKSIIIKRNCYQLIQFRRELLSTNQSTDNQKQTNREQLHNIYRQLADSLPQFFVTQHDFGLYNRQLVFIDNIRNIKTIGLNDYIKQLAFLKMFAHIKYSSKTLNVLKITEHPEDMTVRVRWRVVGTPGVMSIILRFWRYKLWSHKNNVSKDNSEWIDGFSIFFIGNDGLIHKHIVEKIIPDDQQSVARDKDKTTVPLNSAFIVGLVPNLSDFELFKQLIPKLLEMTTKFGFY